MKTVNLLRVVLASPSDVKTERDCLPGVVDEVNRGVAAEHGLRLELLRWETDTYPGFHPEGPQGLIDPILEIDECDILIGIFWKKFGTPTHNHQSGTEHEILTAYEAWKRNQRPHIMLYFNQKPYTPKSVDEVEQWRKVLDFRQRFPKEGLWWAYKGKTEFERLVRRHLTLFLARYSTVGLESPSPASGRDTHQRVKPLRDYQEPNNVQAESDKYRSGSSSKAVKIRILNERRAHLLEDYEAAHAQLSNELSEVARNRLKRQVENLEREIVEVDKKIEQTNN